MKLMFNSLGSLGATEICESVPIVLSNYQTPSPNAYSTSPVSTLVGDKIVMYGQAGTAHTIGGDLYRFEIDSQGNVSDYTKVFDAVSVNKVWRRPYPIYKNGKVYLFCTLKDATDPLNLRRMYLFESTDGEVGKAFTNSLISTGITANTGEFAFGKPITLSDGSILMAWYSFDNIGVHYSTNVMKYDANMNFVATYEIYSGAAYNNETAILEIKSGTLLAISRREDNHTLQQSISTDNGVTWSAYQLMNLVNGFISNVDMIVNDSGTVDIIYFTREDGKMLLSLDNNPDTIIANPLGYNAGKLLYTSPFGYIQGYGGIIEKCAGNYFVSFQMETALGQASPTFTYYSWGNFSAL